MLKQAEDAIHLLWKMKNSEDVIKRQKKTPEKSNNFYDTKEQVAKDSRVKQTAIATKQTKEVLPETEKSAEKYKGVDWRQVYSELESSIRMRHYSPRTLKSYVGYTRQFQAFVKSKDPKCVEVEDVKAFLSFMATEKKVSASSQNLAFNALLYLFRNVFKSDFGKIDGVFGLNANRISLLFYPGKKLI